VTGRLHRAESYPDSGNEGCGGGPTVPLACQQFEQSSMAAVGWIAVKATAQMLRHRPGLFRPQLLIQIFPKPGQNFSTFHTLGPLATPLLAAVEDKNSRNRHLVPRANELPARPEAA
jgi:hypothetical protein